MITHVAIKYRDRIWSLPAPNRHCNVVSAIVAETGEPMGENEQGFLDDQGVFYNRVDAMIHAVECSQLRRMGGGYQGNQLFSEDVW